MAVRCVGEWVGSGLRVGTVQICVTVFIYDSRWGFQRVNQVLQMCPQSLGLGSSSSPGAKLS